MTTSRPCRLDPSPEYSVKRESLTAEQLRQLALAEDRIAADPDDTDGRYPSYDGGQIDYTAGVLIKYRHEDRADGCAVVLEDLLAERPGPRRWPQDED